jgi:hypothetical protein
MKSFNKVLIAISSIILIFLYLKFCNSIDDEYSTKPFSIEPFYAAKAYSYGDTSDFIEEDYLVSGYKEATLEIELKIDSFFCAKRLYEKYGECIVIFYKKSAITNNEHISKYERDLVRYSESHDKIYEYRWKYRRLLKYLWKRENSTEHTMTCL